ncbi:MAG: nucleoside transporter C-terminal domain-containing protein [Thermoanaerobaculia bacterium]|nr:nucleoside transporter C-terminal domain-containing protein [Thermoanaerobaculia bacterium]
MGAKLLTHLNLISLLGLVVFALLAWVVGGCRRPVPWRTVAGSAILTLGLAAVVFLLPVARSVLLVLNQAVLAMLSGSSRGAEFLLGPLAVSPGATTAAGEPSIGFVLAAQVLPAVIFFAAVMATLHHFGAIEPIVRLLGRLFHATLRLSGAEALTGSTHIFFGVETAAAVRPYLGAMTRSELLVVLATNLATVASTTLAVYVIFLRDVFPRIAGHLISASLLSIPCAILVAKLILPERESTATGGGVPAMARSERHASAMGALAAGAWDGLKVAAGISTILIAVLGVVGVLDLLLGRASTLALGLDEPLSIAGLLGWLFRPLAWLLGVEAADLAASGRLLGQRLILTEVVSYQELGGMASRGELAPRTILILSYGLCGFAHVGGMGIAVGGFGALAPDRLEDLASLSLRALAAATLATLMTGALAGLFFHGQTGILGL